MLWTGFPRDLGSTEVPVYHKKGEGQGVQERQQEGDVANQQARLEVLTEGFRFDLGPGQEGQEDRTKAGEEIDPAIRLKVQEIPGEDSQDNFKEWCSSVLRYAALAFVMLSCARHKKSGILLQRDEAPPLEQSEPLITADGFYKQFVTSVSFFYASEIACEGLC